MRISLKLTLGLAATALVTVGAYSARQLRTEESELRTAVERDTRLLGRSLQVALENALRDGQRDDIEELVRRLELLDRGLEITVFDVAGTVRARAGEARFADEGLALRTTALSTNHTVLRFVPDDEPTALLLATPLAHDDRSPLGSILLSRPLAELQADLHATRRANVFLSLAVVAVTTALTLLFSLLYIGRPLARLRDGMRRVRTGDFSTPLPAGSDDEVGALANEFNVMVGELRSARERLYFEAESRRRLERALQGADKLAAVGQLSAGLAHEIGSPLQILAGRARALLSRAHDPDETRRNAEILVAQSDRITRIVEQLLRFARRRPTLTGEVDVADAVRTVADLLEIEAKKRGVTIRLELARTPKLPRSNEDHVQQMVLNLLTNALNATDRGGAVRLAVLPLPSAAGARIVVEDTGRGIAESDLPHVFEPFFTTRADTGGTGLGLAVVKGLVTEHHGHVDVASTPGRGARFTIDLPAGDDVAPRSDA